MHLDEAALYSRVHLSKRLNAEGSLVAALLTTGKQSPFSGQVWVQRVYHLGFPHRTAGTAVRYK